MKKRSAVKRQRICSVCGKSFVAKKTEHSGRYCASEKCKSAYLSQRQLGTKQSPETVAKRTEKLMRRLENPEFKRRWLTAMLEGSERYRAVPENMVAWSERSRATGIRTQANMTPEQRAIRDARSSEILTRVWAEHRDSLISQMIARVQSGEWHLNKGTAEEAKKRAAKWIMTQAQVALREETDYAEEFLRAQERARLRFPFSGTTEDDYYEHLKLIGKETTADPVLVEIGRKFLSDAIPRFAAEWQRRKKNK